MIRLVATDLDDTLLNSKKEISAENREVITALASRGIAVVPVTGRPYYGVPDEVLRLPGVRYVITSNGAVTYDCLEEKQIDAVRIVPERMMEVLQDIRDVEQKLKLEPSWCELFVGGYGYSSRERYRFLMERYQGLPLSRYIRQSRKIVEDIYTFAAECREDVDGIYLSSPDSDTRRTLYDYLNMREDMHTVLSGTVGIEMEALGGRQGACDSASWHISGDRNRGYGSFW